MAEDLNKLADELVEKFKKRAEEMGVILSDEKITVNEVPELVEVAVRVVEDVSKVTELSSLEKKTLALTLFWRMVEQYNLQAELDKWIGVVAKKIHDWDIPRVPDWLIDKVLTEKRIKEILTIVISQMINWIVGWLNSRGWKTARKRGRS